MDGSTTRAFLGLRAKLLAGLAALVVILVIVTLLGNSVLDRYSTSVRNLFAQEYDSAAACQSMKESLERLIERPQMRQWESNPVPLRADDADVKTFEQKLAVQRGIADLPGEVEATAELADAWTRFRGAYADAADPARSYADRRQAYLDRVIPLSAKVHGLAQKIIDMNLAQMEAGRGEAAAMTARARQTMRALAVIAIGLAGAIVLFAGAAVLRPLRQLEESAKQIAKGNLDIALPVRANDEIGQLGRAFNDMAAQLREFKRIDHEKLVRTQRTTQLAIDSLPDAVILIEPRGTIELANETASRLFKLQPGMRTTDLSSPWLSDLHQQAMTDPSPRRASAYAAAIRIEDNGSQRSFLPGTFPIVDEQHRVIGSAVMLADVTDLRRADDMKNNLLATTAHELKTPLTSMRMVMHLITEERIGALNERQRELLVAAREDSDRLHQIVETLLDMDRIRSGKSMMNARPIDARELIERGIQPWRDVIDRRGITLRIEAPAEPMVARADEQRMKHVFGNLVDNAIRYTSAGGTIAISVRAAGAGGAGVHFVVADNGAGIPDTLQYRVFERFFRAPGQPGDSGTGLGLAIVKEIIEAHGGRVWLESREGRGTSVHFVIPGETSTALQEVVHGCEF